MAVFIHRVTGAEMTVPDGRAAEYAARGHIRKPEPEAAEKPKVPRKRAPKKTAE